MSQNKNIYDKGKYGLLITNKSAIKKNVFGDEDSDDSESGTSGKNTTDWMKKKLETNATIKKQTLLKLEKAEKDDPTVFQYDEVYEEMEEKKKSESVVQKNRQENQQPKYISNLLKSAELRNREHERRQERKVQREREAEGDEFKDKEKFVTSAYRKKMEEMERLEEEERRKDALDELTDVTKQKDMSGFYRHLYRQTMGQEKGQKEKEEAEQKDIKKVDVKKKTFRRRHDDDDDEEEDSSDSDESEKEDDKEETRVPELTREEKMEEKRKELRLQKEKREARKRRIELGLDSSSEEEEEKEEEKSKEDDRFKKPEMNSNSKDNNEPVEKAMKLDIWKKITVGKIFDDAVGRFLIRKANRTQFPVL